MEKQQLHLPQASSLVVRHRESILQFQPIKMFQRCWAHVQKRRIINQHLVRAERFIARCRLQPSLLESSEGVKNCLFLQQLSLHLEIKLHLEARPALVDRSCAAQSRRLRRHLRILLFQLGKTQTRFQHLEILE